MSQDVVARIKAEYRSALEKLNNGFPEEARLSFTKLLMEQPNSPEIYYQLSRVAYETGDRTKQFEYLSKSLELKPTEPGLVSTLIDLFDDLGEYDQALKAHDHLALVSPDKKQVSIKKAAYLQRLGRFDEAQDRFRKFIKKDPLSGGLYKTFYTGMKVSESEPTLKSLNRLLKSPKAGTKEKMQGHYAMAKALEDQKKYDQVFAHLHAANALQAELAPIKEEKQNVLHGVFYEKQLKGDLKPIDFESPVTPVFVTGMPRSGTTLTEQIIAAHSNATAGGELGIIFNRTTNLPIANNDPKPLHLCTEDELRLYAETFIRLMQRDTGAKSGVITDKSIRADVIYGYLATAMPQAKFIIVQRDARDIAISIYKNMFKLGSHRYANSLPEIAKAIKAFRKNVEHWKERMPERIYEVYYDQLVADPENQARALIDAAGLEWEDACLEFHKAKNRVKTLSVAQVRQPINKGSSQAWKRYEKDLQPFIEEWGDDPWV